MKRFVLASVALCAAALLAQPAAAADYKGPYKKGPRLAAPYAKPAHAPRRPWTCNEFGNCQPMWGWGKDVATGPVAMVIVARGPIPLVEFPDRYTSCKTPRRVWNGFRWDKVWDANCVR